MIRYGGCAAAGQNPVAATGRRAGQRVAQTAGVRDGELDADRGVAVAHGVRHDIPDERLAEPAVGAPALVGARDRLGRLTDDGPEDGLQLGVEVVDLGLDGRIRA